MATSSRIGLRDVKIAWLDANTDTPSAAAYTMEELTALEAIDAQISRGTADPDVQYADDIESDVLYPDPEITISLEVQGSAAPAANCLFGQGPRRATSRTDSSSYSPPYFAGLQAAKASGADRMCGIQCRANRWMTLPHQGRRHHHPTAGQAGNHRHQAHL